MVLIPTLQETGTKKPTLFGQLLQIVQDQEIQSQKAREKREKEREEEQAIILQWEQEQQATMKIVEATIPKKGVKIVPCIPLQDNEVIDVDKTSLVSFSLKIRPNGSNDSVYKKTVRRFSEGSPRVWIQTIQDINEIWNQNKVQGGSDRAATVRTILRDDALAVFEAALEAAEEGEEVAEGTPLTPEKVDKALKAVSFSVFPHRALENQKLWMRKYMKKPANMKYRILQAKVMKMNRNLAYFPEGSEDSKFSNQELLEILEFSLPQTWAAKFDLDSYVPTKHDLSRLLAECEAIERNENVESSNKSKQSSTKGKDNDKKGSQKTKESKGLKFCSEHGMNPTHDSAKCWILHPKLKPAKFVKKDGSSSKELNALLKKTSKAELMNMFLSSKAVPAKEKAEKKRAKTGIKRKKEESSDSSDASVQIMDVDTPLPSEDEETPPPSEDESIKKKKRIKRLGQAQN